MCDSFVFCCLSWWTAGGLAGLRSVCGGPSPPSRSWSGWWQGAWCALAARAFGQALACLFGTLRPFLSGRVVVVFGRGGVLLLGPLAQSFGLFPTPAWLRLIICGLSEAFIFSPLEELGLDHNTKYKVRSASFKKHAWSRNAMQSNHFGF